MKKHTSPIQCGMFYHVYNRGINGENLFKEERNYHFFLKQYEKYINPIAETYAYCLMKNHFHLLIRTRDPDLVVQNMSKRKNKPTLQPDKIVSNQFAKLFNSYAQAINKAYKRSGGLFEELFRRIPVEQESYFIELVYYIHTNPQKHGFIADFRDYPHTSYHAHLYKKNPIINRTELLDWFGDLKTYESFHAPNQFLEHLPSFEIEFD